MKIESTIILLPYFQHTSQDEQLGLLPTLHGYQHINHAVICMKSRLGGGGRIVNEDYHAEVQGWCLSVHHMCCGYLLLIQLV